MLSRILIRGWYYWGMVEQVSVVQRLKSAIHRINRYPTESIRETNCAIQWIVIYSADNTIHLSNNWRQMAKYIQNKWTSVYKYPSTLIWFLWRKFKGAAIVASSLLYDILPPTSHQSLPLTPRPPIPHHFFWHLTCVQSSRCQPHVTKYGDCLTTRSKPRIFVLTFTLLEFFSWGLI